MSYCRFFGHSGIYQLPILDSVLDFETFAQYHTNSVNVGKCKTDWNGCFLNYDELANGPLIVKNGGKEAYVEPWPACLPLGGPLSWELIRDRRR
jgi:hypothetical protein